MTDPVQAFRTFLEEGASLPHFFVLTLTFILVALLAHGTAELGKRYARERKWNTLALLLVVLGIAAWNWWTPLVGAPSAIIGVVLLMWRPTRTVMRTARRRQTNRQQRETTKGANR